MLLEVQPAGGFSGTFRLPSSKPETQRAILASALADGRSRVFNDLRCRETETMKEACRALGAEIIERDAELHIHGVANSPRCRKRVIDAEGSGFVFRTVTALASAQPCPVVITGDETLRRRVMSPLFDALRELGADIESIGQPGNAPVVNWGGGLRGGRCRLPGDVSSQFITAVLFAAPLAERPVEIDVTGDLYSRSYLRQSIRALSEAGIEVAARDDYSRLRVEPSAYRPHDFSINEDYTSASYLLAAAALFKGRSIFLNVHADSQQGEAAIVGILEQLGVRITPDPVACTLIVENPDGILRGDLEVDVRDCPNIAPTLAAVGAYVRGRLRVVGASLAQLHKAPRIEAMVTELSRAGVDIRTVHRGGVCDGFEVCGAASYRGGCTFSSRGDHRIFMSLFVASLRMNRPCYCSGFASVQVSFPDFFHEFAKAGVRTSMVESGDGLAAEGRPVAVTDQQRPLECPPTGTICREQRRLRTVLP